MLRAADLIAQKRDGLEHSPHDLEAFIQGYTNRDIPDYQMSAWLMAAYLKGLSLDETVVLTLAMARSGDQLDLSALSKTIDKHSTGGVGDKTSLVVTPMLAALGFTVAKMSGRCLGYTGGTIDKLESIPGWHAELSEQAFIAQAREIGLALVGQSKNLAPADGLLYALRDVTATVDSIPLIASSIMSKKLAAGAQTIVLDVKVGSGAFMKTLDQAQRLAEIMVHIGTQAGRHVRVVLTNMEGPLGQKMGNALEVREAIEALRGHGPSDLMELCLELAVQALEAYGVERKMALEQAQDTISSGHALEKLAAFVQAQGGDATYIHQPEKLVIASHTVDLCAEHGGYLGSIDALAAGKAILALGGGRNKKGDSIDHSVGIELLKTPGHWVEAGEPLVRIYHNNRGLEETLDLLGKEIHVSETRPVRQPLILGYLGRQ